MPIQGELMGTVNGVEINDQSYDFYGLSVVDGQLALTGHIALQEGPTGDITVVPVSLTDGREGNDPPVVEVQIMPTRYVAVVEGNELSLVLGCVDYVGDSPAKAAALDTAWAAYEAEQFGTVVATLNPLLPE